MNDPASVRLAVLAVIAEFRASPCRQALSQGDCPDPVSRMFRLIQLIEAARRRPHDAMSPPGCDPAPSAGSAADIALVGALADCQSGRFGDAKARLAAIVRPGLQQIAFSSALETALAFKTAGVTIASFDPPVDEPAAWRRQGRRQGRC